LVLQAAAVYGSCIFFAGDGNNLPTLILLSDFPKVVKEKYRNLQRFFMENISPSGQVKLILNALNMNQTAFSRLLGLSQGVISEFTSGSREPSKEFLLGISKIGISLDWFLTGEGEMYLKKSPEKALVNGSKTGLKRVPIYSEADLPEGAFVVPLLNQRLSAGGGAYVPKEDAVTALVRVPKYLARFGENLRALEVDGDSMYPTLSRGDMVVCDICGWSGEGVYAVLINGDGFVKRLTKAPGKIVIISDNKNYRECEEPGESDNFKIIGRVQCALVNKV
jgi:phage repressor protein C with HTH and peptisase S24 domain